MQTHGNLIMAIIMSVLIIMGWHYYYERPQIEQRREMQLRAKNQAEISAPAAAAAQEARPRTEIIAEGRNAGTRLTINTPRLHGSINLQGARLDDLTLAGYRESIDPQSPEIVLFAPAGSAKPDMGYYTEIGWISGDGVKVPDASTVWQTDRDQLTPNQPVTLNWDNGAGLRFEIEIAVDENYLFTAKQRVINSGTAEVKLFPYSLVSRHGTPNVLGYAILHEGPYGVFNGRLEEFTYKKLTGTEPNIRNSDGGWVGITDKYWLAALIPDQAQNSVMRVVHSVSAQNTTTSPDRWQIDLRAPQQVLAAGATAEQVTRLFAGAKEVRLIDQYEKNLAIEHFDLTIDFGWFYFLTKPFFYAIDYLAGIFRETGYGFALAILLFTVVIKTLLYPLTKKSNIAMNRLKELQPEMEKLKERFKDKKQDMQMEIIKLYQREKVNPASGCLPMLLQIPIFFALYKVLFVTIEMRHAPFFGWIADLSARDPTSPFNLFGLLPYDVPTFLHIGIWPILMGISMWAQQKMNPTPTDPIQAKVFAFLPWLFVFMLAGFPAGLVIYWTWSNTLSIGQQWWLKRHWKKHSHKYKRT